MKLLIQGLSFLDTSKAEKRIVPWSISPKDYSQLGLLHKG
jgi:hypothetical protein